jgi:hypothetical protein
MLQQQSMEPLQQQTAGGMVIPLNPLAGLAKVLQSYTSSRQLSDLDKKRAGLEAEDMQRAREMFDQFRPTQTVTPPTDAPMAAPNTFGSSEGGTLNKSFFDNITKNATPNNAPSINENNPYQAPVPSSPQRSSLEDRKLQLIIDSMGAGPNASKMAEMLYNYKPEVLAPLYDRGNARDFTPESRAAAQDAQLRGHPNPSSLLVPIPTAVNPRAVNPTTVLRNGKSVVIDANTGNEIGDAVVPRVPSEPLVPIYGPDGIPTLVTRENAVGKKPYTASTATQDLKEADRQRLATQASISTQDMLDNAAILISHPGRIAATGGSSRLSVIPGTDAYNFQARLDTFKAQTFLPMVSAMKGAGALSDKEGEKLSEAVGALDPKMTEDEFEKSLRSIIDRLYRNAIAGGLNVSMPPMPDSKLPPGFKLD